MTLKKSVDQIKVNYHLEHMFALKVYMVVCKSAFVSAQSDQITLSARI